MTGLARQVLNSATSSMAKRCLYGAAKLDVYDVSFLRAMAAIAEERSPTPEQRARLEAIARRVGATP